MFNQVASRLLYFTQNEEIRLHNFTSHCPLFWAPAGSNPVQVWLGPFSYHWILSHERLSVVGQPWLIDRSPRTLFSSGSPQDHISPVSSRPDQASWPFSITVPSQRSHRAVYPLNNFSQEKSQ